MSRELKFRVLDDESKWFYFKVGDSLWWRPEDVKAVEQYTGLKDRNGKKIYEGDILSVWIGKDKQNTPYVVKDMRKLYCEFNHDDGYYRFSEVEIIGNVHENTELVKLNLGEDY